MQFGAKNWVNFKYKLLQILDIFLQRKEIRGFRPWIDGEEYVRPPHFCLGLKRPSPPPFPTSMIQVIHIKCVSLPHCAPYVCG